ncbi:MAG: SCO family protein [Verrucomicrobiales bacterium]|nr:SCO family protein [Verrucomicrobiales bacterium]MCP5559696.1 SCO family protein [Verrucomicrobiaceae bacterium]
MNAQSPAISTSVGPRLWVIVFGAIALIISASLFLSRQLNQSLPGPALPIHSVIQHDLTAIERSGQTVHFSDLKGKVVTCAYIYTVCPHGCAAVIGQMQKLQQTFGSRDDFHQVSISVIPERDTASFLGSYAQGLGLTPADPWWFLSGQQKPLWDFMTDELKLEPAKAIPEDERMNPLDLFEHDLRIVLIDRKGRVRGYYSVFHPQPEIAALMCDKLFKDTQRLLNDPEA